MLIRSCKVVLLVTLAIFFTLVALGNVTDYDTNHAFVMHVLAMDTIFPNSTLASWRAITDPNLQEIAYWGIIAWEILTAVVLWIAALRLWMERDSGPAFQSVKGMAVVGLTMAFLLYGLGFMVIGGEWFAMWQSSDWNGQAAATRFLVLIGLVFLVVLHRDDD